MKKFSKCLLLYIIFGILLTSVISCGPGSMEFYIFDDIDECKKIQQLEFENGKVNEYTSPSNDEYSKGLLYNDFFAAKYESKEVEFEIYAYLFDSEETSKSYFKNATGKDDDMETNFLVSGGIGLYEITVIDCEKAYTVFTSRSQLETVKKMLGEIFTIKLDI